MGIDEPLEVYESGASYYYHADGLGTITTVTKRNGSVANTYTYTSFGNPGPPNETVANPFKFTAREYDSETKLYYYRARYYDPLFGRFLSEDSVRFAQGVNFYRYAENNPVRFTDAYGHGVWACAKCAYYQYKCLKEASQCREELNKKYPDPVDLCSATNSPSPGDAYFKECFAKQASCQKMVSNCGQCGLWPAVIGDPHFHK